ncbi:MAG: hypothetical protein J5898_01590 [Lachnospiraceae bacterium]|nr:hypothetical protein [Lachnospiraceae bacterium]
MLNRFLFCVFFSFFVAASTFDLQGEDTPGSRTFTEKDAQKLYESLDETNKEKWNSIESRKQGYAEWDCANAVWKLYPANSYRNSQNIWVRNPYIEKVCEVEQ